MLLILFPKTWSLLVSLSVFADGLTVLSFINSAYAQGFIPLLQTESFPEHVQSSGAGMIEGISQIGSFMTPFVMSIFQKSGQKPIIYFAIIVLVIGIFPLKWVRETLVVKKSSKGNPLEESLNGK